MTYSTYHHTFTVEREVSAPPALAFFAWADKDAKAAWFGAPTGWTQLIRDFDFREGGSERVKGLWDTGTTSDFQCQYHDIVQDQRIVFSYDMYVNDHKISVSLQTIDFTPTATGTHLKITEQIVHLDGYPTPEDREHGTRYLLAEAAAWIEKSKT